MAGIENIVVHSKSYLVRWIQVPEQHSISWSVQPHKKSINFGIFKHPGHKNGLAPPLPTHETLDQPPTAVPAPASADSPVQEGKRAHRGSVSRHASQALVEKLQGIGLRSVAWTGKCEADKVSMGLYDVAEGEGGMYGLVFDNTFSKTTGKTITFVLMTHPTNAPPKSGHHLHYSQAFAPGAQGGRKASNPSLRPLADSVESLHSVAANHRGVLEDPRPKSNATESRGLEGSTFYTGVLHKKRRKKGQGHAKRFFSLDFTSSTLSYYRDRHSSALRGAVPLSLASIAVNEKAREFTVDSGAELWHLKASNRRDFDGWKDALERAAAAANTASSPATPPSATQGFVKSKQLDPAEQNEWAQVEQLVSKVAGSRDAVRRLAKDTDPKYAPGAPGVGLSHTTSNSSSTMPSPVSPENANDYFQEVSEEKAQEKRPFWKRKPSTTNTPRNSGLIRRTVSGQLAVPASPGAAMSPSVGSVSVPKTRQPSRHDDDVHERCMALLRDLDEAVAGFSALIAESKSRRMPPLPVLTSRLSIESTRSEEFFDAVDGTHTPSQFLTIRRSSEFEETNEANENENEANMDDQMSDADSDASSTVDGGASDPMYASASTDVFLAKPKTLTPLPLPPTKRRGTLLAPKQAPPSIIGFLRKNAGKDLSTVSMPVTANEPTSLLQRLSECMEYSPLLDSAASASLPASERLLYVAAFALSGLAYNRVKERAIRKPFNPMLGETFELVREDLGFRFLAEKVSHHPVRAACQAESLNNGGWCFAQSPQPVQKFWGKSVELNTEGRSHAILHAPNEGKGEHYSWNQATCFLRNVIAGEKYVEPVQSMTIVNETNGMRAVATFKAGGMFAGRSEEVTVQLFDPSSGEAPISLGLAGKWTESLKRTDTGADIWKAGPLVADSAKVYGFTTFAASLNEITENEDGFLPPTDSRLRPDQRLLEQGEVDKAEATKAKLEERQRSRKKVRDSHGTEWKPQFFEKVTGEGEELWKLREKGGYWERRVKGDWNGVEEVFEA